MLRPDSLPIHSWSNEITNKKVFLGSAFVFPCIEFERRVTACLPNLALPNHNTSNKAFQGFTYASFAFACA